MDLNSNWMSYLKRYKSNWAVPSCRRDEDSKNAKFGSLSLNTDAFIPRENLISVCQFPWNKENESLTNVKISIKRDTWRIVSSSKLYEKNNSANIVAQARGNHDEERGKKIAARFIASRIYSLLSETSLKKKRFCLR